MNESDLKNLRQGIQFNLAFRSLWSKTAELILQFHEEMQKENGPAIIGRPRGEKSGWGIRETSQELGISIGMVSDYLAVAKALRADPDLKYREFRHLILDLRKIKNEDRKRSSTIDNR